MQLAFQLLSYVVGRSRIVQLRSPCFHGNTTPVWIPHLLADICSQRAGTFNTTPLQPLSARQKEPTPGSCQGPETQGCQAGVQMPVWQCFANLQPAHKL